MADALARHEPVPAQPVEFPGVTIALAPPMKRWSLRARNAGVMAVALGRTVPETIGGIEDGALMLGPDEWLLRLSEDTDIDAATDTPVSIVDVSERQIAIVIEGRRAVEVIQGGNPLDLAKFPVGTGKRTIFEGVEIVLIREGETRFVIEVWRSFAEFVWGVLAKSASEG